MNPSTLFQNLISKMSNMRGMSNDGYMEFTMMLGAVDSMFDSGNHSRTEYWPDGRLKCCGDGTEYWPNGQLKRANNGDVYWPNGQVRSTRSGEEYWPNGQLKRANNGTEFWPNGDLKSY